MPVYHIPELDRNRSYFTYAAEGHLQLSRPGELLISYVVNSHDFRAMFQDATIYRPRFISMAVSGVTGQSPACMLVTETNRLIEADLSDLAGRFSVAQLGFLSNGLLRPLADSSASARETPCTW